MCPRRNGGPSGEAFEERAVAADDSANRRVVERSRWVPRKGPNAVMPAGKSRRFDATHIDAKSKLSRRRIIIILPHATKQTLRKQLVKIEHSDQRLCYCTLKPGARYGSSLGAARESAYEFLFSTYVEVKRKRRPSG